MKKLLLIIFLIFPFSLYAGDSIGVYMQNGDNITKIEPIKYIQTKSNALAGAFTMGIASTTLKTIFRGSQSENIANANTKFYLYFTSNIDPMLMVTYFAFALGSSPRPVRPNQTPEQRSMPEPGGATRPPKK